MEPQSRRSRLESVIRCLIPYYWVILLGAVVVMALSLPFAIRLLKSLNTELSKLLPDDHPSIVESSEIKKKFKKKGGGDLILIVSSDEGKIDSRMIDDLQAYLQKSPDVERVKYQKEAYDFLNSHKLLYIDRDDLESIKERISRKIQQEKLGALYIDFEEQGDAPADARKKKDPFTFDDITTKYRTEYLREVKSPYLTNEEESAYALWIYPKSTDTSLGYYQKFFNVIDDYLKSFPKNEYGASIKFQYAGSIRTRIDEIQTLKSDLKKAGLISLTGILLILFLYFRSFAGVILLFIPLSGGLIVGFAVCSLFLTHLNVVTSFLFAILTGLGIEIGIHMFARYREDRLSGASVQDSIVAILLKTGRSAVAGVTLNCVTFFILVLNQFRGFSEFGWIAGIGLLASLVSYLVFYPALLILAEKIRIISFKALSPDDPKRTLVGWVTHQGGSFPAARGVVLACSGIFVLSLFLIPRIEFEWNYSLLKMQVPQTKEAKTRLRAITGRVNSAAAIIIPGKEEAMALKEEIKRKKETDKDSPTLDYFKSYYDLLPTDQTEKMKLLKEIDSLLEDDALKVVKGKDKELIADFRKGIRDTKMIRSEEEIPQSLKEVFFGKGEFFKEQVAFVNPLPYLELDDGRNAVAFYNDVHEVSVLGKTYHAVSDAVIFAQVLLTLFSDSRRVILLSIFVLMVVLYLDFRNFSKAAMAFGSVVWGVLGMGVLMVFLGLKFNFYNMIIIPLVLGMAVDNAVHLLHRFEEYEKKSVMKALATSGTAAGISSLTNLLGYSGLVFAHHPGLNSLGLLAVLGMLACMVGSLVFLPAVLQFMMEE